MLLFESFVGYLLNCWCSTSAHWKLFSYWILEDLVEVQTLACMVVWVCRHEHLLFSNFLAESCSSLEGLFAKIETDRHPPFDVQVCSWDWTSIDCQLLLGWIELRSAWTKDIICGLIVWLGNTAKCYVAVQGNLWVELFLRGDWWERQWVFPAMEARGEPFDSGPEIELTNKWPGEFIRVWTEWATKFLQWGRCEGCLTGLWKWWWHAGVL